jgi:hypothetical protein
LTLIGIFEGIAIFLGASGEGKKIIYGPAISGKKLAFCLLE